MVNRSARQSGLANVAVAATVIFGILLSPPGRGQSSTGQRSLAFEVASIKPAAIWKAGGEGSSRSQIEHSADSLTMENIDLSEMVQWAYGVQPFQVSGQGTSKDRRYDIRAKSGDPVSVATLKVMLQDLLATRFKLKLHREHKKTSVYELVVAKGGPRLPANKADTLPSSHAKESLPRVVDGSFVFLNTSITEFAEQLTHLRGIDQPVVDRSGIEGIYDITLKGAASAVLQPDGPSLFTLVQEQLGLKLVAAKDPIEVVVIDDAEEPTGN